MISDIKKIKEMEKDLDNFPDLIIELNERFDDLEGLKNKVEFSRCIVFFLLGRLYEQKYSKGAAS